MTRVNCVPPSELSDKHLGAEWYELRRIYTSVMKAIEAGKKPKDYAQYDKYVLGPGHMKFFYTRCGWVMNRYADLYEECLARGRQVTMPLCPVPLGHGWCGHWTPTEADMKLNRQRLRERS